MSGLNRQDKWPEREEELPNTWNDGENDSRYYLERWKRMKYK